MGMLVVKSGKFEVSLLHLVENDSDVIVFTVRTIILILNFLNQLPPVFQLVPLLRFSLVYPSPRQPTLCQFDLALQQIIRLKCSPVLELFNPVHCPNLMGRKTTITSDKE